ncbi:hypothetical protein [Rubritalea marina]|uniref:hypothetical protein n=1 Tax=Rubritalea marina TaxID=361055 RepID=UPI00035E25AB|nr:hypothetical protein [Rubritalea marina]
MPVSKPKQAPEHVEIVQSIMLHSQQHRAILIPTQLFIGILSITIGAALTFKANIHTGISEYHITTGTWIGTWMLAAFAPIIVASALRSRQSKVEQRNKQDRAESHHGHLAHIFRSLAPALLLGAVTGTSIAFADVRQLPLTASLWIACYGVALLSIRMYCTKSTRFLGILMLALGLSFSIVAQRTIDLIHPIQLANFFMILSFGMFHLVVASGSILFEKSKL